MRKLRAFFIALSLNGQYSGNSSMFLSWIMALTMLFSKMSCGRTGQLVNKVVIIITRLLLRSRRITEKKHSMKTSKAPLWAGFTLVEIMIVVAIIGLLAAIAIPSFVHARAKSQATICINNLRQIEAAVVEVALEKGKHVGDTVNYPDDITPFIKLNSAGSIPGCPAGGVYSLQTVGTIPQAVCSLSTTVDPPHVLQ
jgi:prepilin-type N-terminal cleavage/methylation domain-containing protein